jgi:hypothetical protein
MPPDAATKLGDRPKKSIGILLGSVLGLVSCSQITNYTYSRNNLNSSTFESDLAACGHPSSSMSAFQSPTQLAQPDDAMVRECMKNKGYKVEAEPR